MVHPLVEQLRFARSELQRCLEGVTEEDARRRLGPMNCLSWIVGHLANQEHWYWVRIAQGRDLFPELDELVGTGRPASTPPLAEMWTTWEAITAEADRYLDTLDPERLQSYFAWEGKTLKQSVGRLLWRNITHYWFHIGEAHAIRQQLGHTDLPDFVGRIPPYRPEWPTKESS